MPPVHDIDVRLRDKLGRRTLVASAALQDNGGYNVWEYHGQGSDLGRLVGEADNEASARALMQKIAEHQQHVQSWPRAEMTGEELYNELGGSRGESSKILQDAGLVGIKYRDQGSRNRSINADLWHVEGPTGYIASFSKEQEARDYASQVWPGGAPKNKITPPTPETHNYVVFPGHDKAAQIERVEEPGKPPPDFSPEASQRQAELEAGDQAKLTAEQQAIEARREAKQRRRDERQQAKMQPNLFGTRPLTEDKGKKLDQRDLFGQEPGGVESPRGTYRANSAQGDSLRTSTDRPWSLCRLPGGEPYRSERPTAERRNPHLATPHRRPPRATRQNRVPRPRSPSAGDLRRSRRSRAIPASKPFGSCTSMLTARCSPPRR